MRNPIVKLVIFLTLMAIILITLVTLEQRRRQPEFSPVFFSLAPHEILPATSLSDSWSRAEEIARPIA